MSHQQYDMWVYLKMRSNPKTWNSSGGQSSAAKAEAIDIRTTTSCTHARSPARRNQALFESPMWIWRMAP